jgi:hypothetical protein
MKLWKVIYEVDDDNVSLSTFNFANEDLEGIALNIGRTVGSDGEEALFTVKEFGEFIDECIAFYEKITGEPKKE